MSLKVTLLFCVIAHLVQSDPYVRYGRFPARGVLTVNTGFGIGGLNGGLATGLAAQTLGQALGQAAVNRLTAANRPAGSIMGYTTLGSILSGTALRPTSQTSGSVAQNINAQASLQASTTTANSGNSNGMQGGWTQGVATPSTQNQSPTWQNGAAGGIAGHIGAAGGIAGHTAAAGGIAGHIGAAGGIAGHTGTAGGIAGHTGAAGGIAGHIGADIQMANQNGASISNGANSMNQATWTDVSRQPSAASQNPDWQSGISASMAGQSVANSNFNSPPGQSVGGSTTGMSQSFNWQGRPTGSMQAGMNAGQVAHQNAGTSSTGVGIGTNGQGNWALQRPSQGTSSQTQVSPARPSSNLQINANGHLATSKDTGMSGNGHATTGATSSSGQINQASWTDVSRPSIAASHNSDWQGGISSAGQSVVNSNFNSALDQTGGGSKTGVNQSFNWQGRPGTQVGSDIGSVTHQNTGASSIGGGINLNGQENWSMQRPSQSTSSQTHVLPARPSSSSLQINASGQLAASKNTGISVDAHAAIGTTASRQPSQNLQTHDNENGLNGSSQREQSQQTQHQYQSADDWWGLGQIDNYPQSWW